MKNACFEKITILELGFENMIFKKAIEYLVKSVKSVVTVKNCNVKMLFFDNLKKNTFNELRFENTLFSCNYRR